MECEVSIAHAVPRLFQKDACVFCGKKKKMTKTKHGCDMTRRSAVLRCDQDMLDKLNCFNKDELFFYHVHGKCYSSYTNSSNIKKVQLKIQKLRYQVSIFDSLNYTPENECVSQNFADSSTSFADNLVSAVSSVLDNIGFDNGEEPMAGIESNDSVSDDSNNNGYGENCVFCKQDKHKQIRKKHLMVDIDRAELFYNYSQYFSVLKDLSLSLTSKNDVLQKRIFYHNSCIRLHEQEYTRYLKKIQLANTTPINSELDYSDELMPSATDITKKKQNEMKEAVDSILPQIKSGECFTLTELCNNVNQKLVSSNTKVSNRDLRNYIENNYKDDIKFVNSPKHNKSALIYYSKITIEEVLITLRHNNIKNSGQILRESLKKVDFDLEDRFCDASDLRNSWDNMNVPADVLQFLSGLLNFNDKLYTTESTKISDSKLLEIKSTFQILYFLVNNGRKKAPLQVMTGLSIHGSCKSRSLITSLNHMGISISYDEVQRTRTALASYTVKANENVVPLPAHFDPNSFTTAAFDNFDHNEATESGLNSTHDTVTVLVQDDTELDLRKPKISQTDVNRRIRTFDETLKCQQLQQFHKPAGKIYLPSDSTVEDLNLEENDFNKLNVNELAWTLSRMDISSTTKVEPIKKHQETPPWSATQSIVATDDRPVQKVGFLPILPHPATLYTTVFTVLCNLQSTLSQLAQKNLAVFCDEGTYHIARHITLTCKDRFKDILPMLGNFHLQKVIIACIGKYLTGSVVEHIFIETGIFGVNVVHQVLKGINYNRSIKGLFMLAEVLQRLQVEAFFEQHDREDFDNDLSHIQIFQDILREGHYEECQGVYDKFEENIKPLYLAYTRFVKKRCEESDLFKYWNNVIIMIQLLKDSLKADRLGDWNLHVKTIQKLQALFHIMDRTNYIRWCSIYLNDILNLKQTHPELYRQFMKGKFTVKRSNIPFISVSPDQNLEQTTNRSKKSIGGVIGTTLNKASVAAWDMNHHEVLFIENLFREKTGVRNDNYEFQVHHGLSNKKTDDLELKIFNLIGYIKDHVNPFMSGRQALRNLITEELVDLSVKTPLLNVFKDGCAIFNNYWAERFVNKEKSLCTPIARNRFPSFRDKLNYELTRKSAKKLKVDQSTSTLIVDLARERLFCLKKLFTYELKDDNYLFESENILRKETAKSSLVAEIMKLTDIQYSLNKQNVDNMCLVIDAMVICRKIQWSKLSTFGDFAKSFCGLIQNMYEGKPRRIDLVFDSYFSNSIKACERRRRYGSDFIELKRITESIKLPLQSLQFWASSNNKVLLQDFLRDYIKNYGAAIWPGTYFVFSVGNGKPCESTVYPEQSLRSLQNDRIEEADLKIMLHIKHAGTVGYDNVFVATTDTDVLTLLLYHWDTFNLYGIKELWNLRFHFRTKYSILPIHIVATSLGSQICNSLPALHHLTGSDYTSKVGTKYQGINALTDGDKKVLLVNFAQGALDTDIQDSILLGEKYLLQTLSKDTAYKTFDEQRYFLYHYGKVPSVFDLPPTSKSIKLHILRAFYATYNQISIFKDNTMDLNPLDFGYEECDGNLLPYPVREIFPPINELVPSCNCKKCARKTCYCVAAGVPCCRFCTCQQLNSCQNKNL